jgi:hypothetical protein
MTRDDAELIERIGATRRSLWRIAVWRRACVAFLLGAALLLPAALASRLVPGTGLDLWGVVVAASVFVLFLLGPMRERLGEREAALFLDRILDAEEHVVAGL